MFKSVAPLIGASLCLSACLPPLSHHTSNSAVSHCQAVAHYIAGQYATRTDNALPVQYDRGDKQPGFIVIKEPSIYDVMFQHRGFDAVVETCLERHNMT